MHPGGRPAIKILDVVANIASMLPVSRATAMGAHLFKSPAREADIKGSLCRAQEGAALLRHGSPLGFVFHEITLLFGPDGHGAAGRLRARLIHRGRAGDRRKLRSPVFAGRVAKLPCWKHFAAASPDQGDAAEGIRDPDRWDRPALRRRRIVQTFPAAGSVTVGIMGLHRRDGEPGLKPGRRRM